MTTSRNLRRILIAASLIAAAPVAKAGDVLVTLTGNVDTNSYSSGIFGGLPVNSTAILSFEVSVPGTPTAPGQFVNYAIDLPTFDLNINGSSTGAALGGPTNLGIQNNFPVADGFRIFQTQLATNQFFTCEFGTGGSFFSSVDITQLGGTYDVAANLTSFGYTIQGQGGFMEIFPETLVISSIYEAYCFGDGGNGMGCTDCPCGNNAPSGSGGGCLNSASTSAVLASSGAASVANDTLRFQVTDANTSTFGVLTSGVNQLPAMGPCPVGSGIQSTTLDGLRCIGGGLVRHGTRATDANGDAGVTNNGWGPPSGPAGGLLAQGGFASGQTRHFQCFYRESAALVCMTGQNTTNAVTVVVGP